MILELLLSKNFHSLPPNFCRSMLFQSLRNSLPPVGPLQNHRSDNSDQTARIPPQPPFLPYRLPLPLPLPELTFCNSGVMSDYKSVALCKIVNYLGSRAMAFPLCRSCCFYGINTNIRGAAVTTNIWRGTGSRWFSWSPGPTLGDPTQTKAIS